MRILGAYSRLPTGVTAGEAPSPEAEREYFFVRLLADDRYEIQSLNANHVPSGKRDILATKEFLTSFAPEIEFYDRTVKPVMDSLRKKIEHGWSSFKSGRLNEAENAFCKALLIDENNAESCLGLGNVYCEQKEYEKLRRIIERLLDTEDAFHEELRHAFNAFGIMLRKQKLYEFSVRYYDKALNVDAEDENLHFNVARAYYETGELELSREHLEKALALSPEFVEAKRFLRFMETRGAQA